MPDPKLFNPETVNYFILKEKHVILRKRQRKHPPGINPQ